MPDIFTLENKIKQIFLYKFLNDKFMANMKKFANEMDMSTEGVLQDADMLAGFYDTYSQDVAFKYEDTIERLINKVGNNDFYRLFDDALERISNYSENEEFTIDTADGGRKPLFTRVTENVEASKRNNFAKNIFGIISQDNIAKILVEMSPVEDKIYDVYDPSAGSGSLVLHLANALGKGSFGDKA